MIVFYHASCNDGSCAAAICKAAYPKATFIPCQYGWSLDVKTICGGQDVILVDFTFPAEAMTEIMDVAKSVTAIDHHKSALPTLYMVKARGGKVVFDIEHSGAMLAWIMFKPVGISPLIPRYVEDRDLWRYRMLESKEVNAYLDSIPYDVDSWLNELRDERTAHEMALDGRAVLMYKTKMVDNLAKRAFKATLGGYETLVTNASFVWSDVADELLKRNPHLMFCAAFFQREDHRIVYSLRSRDEFDVAAVAEKFPGGGGHKHAAGFEVDEYVHVRL